MPVTLVPRERQPGFAETIQPMLQMGLDLALQRQLMGIQRERFTKEFGLKEKAAEREVEKLDILRGAAERDLVTQAMKLTKARKDVPGIGKAYIHQEDVARNLQMLRTLQTTAETAEDDLTTFIENPAEREALKKTNPLIYKQFLTKAQAQGSLTQIEIEEEPIKERVPFRLPPPPTPVLPPTAPPEARGAEQVLGRVRQLGTEALGAVGRLPSQALGLGATGYNILAGGTAGLTGIPQATVPPHILNLLRRGELFQQPFQNIQQTGQALTQGLPGTQTPRIPQSILDVIGQGQPFQQPLQNIRQTGQALGQGVGVAGDFYKNLIQRIMQRQGVR